MPSADSEQSITRLIGMTRADVLLGGRVADSTAADEVWVDGKVITGLNFDTAANFGDVRIKKLNNDG